MTIADRIKKRREDLGITQLELAEQIGLRDKSSISKIESSRDNVSLKTVKKVAAALDCCSAYLLGYTDDPYNPTELFIESNDFQRTIMEAHKEADEMERRWEALQDLTDTEVEIINRYRDADGHTRRMIEYMLRIEEVINGNR